MVELLYDPYKKSYTANIVSCATLFCVVVTAIIVILPFALCYNTKIWLSDSTYSEHPLVSFTNEAIIEIAANDGSHYFYSTNPTLGELFHSTLNRIPAIVKSISTQSTSVSPEKIGISISVPCLSSSVNIIQTKIAVEMEYSLTQNVKMKMRSPLVFSFNQNSIGGADVSGVLRLKQKNILDESPIPRTIYNQTVFDSDFSQMFSTIYNRNESLYLDGVQSVYEICSEEALFSFAFTIPELEQIRYAPSAMKALKYAWTQYFSLLYPIYFLLFGLMGIIFRNRIIPTRVEDERGKKYKNN